MGNQPSAQSPRQIEQQTLVDRGDRVCATDWGRGMGIGIGIGIGRTKTLGTQPAFSAGQAVTSEGPL